MPCDFAIKIDHLTKQYHHHTILNDISCEITPHQVVGIIGPNGAGKSTLLKIIAGMLEGTSGEIAIFGKSVTDFPWETQKMVSMMLENNPLLNDLRVGEYLRLRALLKGIFFKNVRQETEKMMRRCDLYYEARHRKIGTLSQGFRQRIGIADAMLGPASVIVLDEPTLGLDPLQIAHVKNSILQTKNNRTVIISSHVLSDLESICDRFLILKKGILVAQGTLDELRAKIQQVPKTEIELEGDREAIFLFLQKYATALTLLSENVDTRRFRLCFSGEEKQKYALMTDLLQQNHIILHAFHNHLPSLETIYLEFTQEYLKGKENL